VDPSPSHRHFLCFLSAATPNIINLRQTMVTKRERSALHRMNVHVVTSIHSSASFFFNRRTKHRSLPMVLFSLHSQWRESVAQVSPLYCILHLFEFMVVHPCSRRQTPLTFAFLFSPESSDLHCDCLLRRLCMLHECHRPFVRSRRHVVVVVVFLEVEEASPRSANLSMCRSS
jgi:hypothetical protein